MSVDQITTWAIFDLIKDGEYSRVEKLLQEKFIKNPNSTNSDGKPLLVVAADAGQYGIINELIKMGANPNATSSGGYTALMRAAFHGHLNIAQLLVSEGANLNAQTNKRKYSALMLASCNSHKEVAIYLIDAGADLSLIDEHDEDVMDYISDSELVKLIEGKINKLKDSDGKVYPELITKPICRAIFRTDTIPPFQTVSLNVTDLKCKMWNNMGYWRDTYVDVADHLIQLPLDGKIEYHVMVYGGEEVYVKFPLYEVYRTG